MSRHCLVALLMCSAVASAASDEASVRVSIAGRITRLGLEEYVARVVAGEGQPTAAAGAQQALAITARTFALANLNRHRREGYDLCDTTHCQVLRPASDAARRAARATAGRLLLHQGQPARVFYSALCGGHSELASQVWPGADDSSSHLQQDEACRDEPGWSSEVRATQIERALRAIGHRGRRLGELRIVQRNASGRVSRLRVDGFTPNEISGHDFRMAMIREVGVRQFKSTAFSLRRTGATYRFAGTGFGHGVGLCVIGAGNRAARGQTADAILKFYFPNLTVSSSVAASKRPGAGASSSTSRLAAAPLTNSGASSPEVAKVIALARAAGAEIAKTAGVTPPGEFRITVHPSVEAFVRATGQPWWVSGASDGGHIELVPLAILQQRGQLERTIRREVARATVDSRLRGRPMWVREGAVAYFADPLAASEAPTTANCPKDDELLRPLSAGAHRDALARAEACFRRQVRNGKAWSEVR